MGNASDFFLAEAIFWGSGQHNQARRLNERTWELGDVFELFLQLPGKDAYLEIHVTPENQRLQLAWPADGLERVFAKKSSLCDFMVVSPHWVESHVLLDSDWWFTQVTIPVEHLGIDSFPPHQSIRGTVCRYHYVTPVPVLSSTAPLQQPFFHRRGDWPAIPLV